MWSGMGGGVFCTKNCVSRCTCSWNGLAGSWLSQVVGVELPAEGDWDVAVDVHFKVLCTCEQLEISSEMQSFSTPE